MAPLEAEAAKEAEAASEVAEAAEGSHHKAKMPKTELEPGPSPAGTAKTEADVF